MYRTTLATIAFAISVLISTPLLAQVKTGVAPKVAPKPRIGTEIVIPPPDTSVSVQFARINMGPNINSQYSELFPILTPDETVMFFARKGDPSNAGYAKNKLDEDIWYSLRQPDGSWSKAVRMEGPLNTENYDGVRAINATATHLYLQNVYNPDGTGAKGFSMSTKQPDGSWGYPEPLVIDDYYNDTTTAMMTISSDEKTIIFSLMRKGGKGEHDFYLSHNLGGMHWSQPELIEELSTVKDDIAPFMAYEDHSLYFSTNGRGGFGGYDIFVSRRIDDTWMHWSEPTNLGEPINTASFDAYFTMGATGDTAYFSSSHETSTRGFGKSDIWKLGLKEELRPGFLMPHGHLWDTKLTEKELKGAVFRLDDVHFDVGKSTITHDSRLELDKVVDAMKRLPALRIEVQGHTDSDGDYNRNIALSQQRAESVCNYIEALGVARDRLQAKGYGPARPIAPNDSPAGKALNRRVMIEVVN